MIFRNRTEAGRQLAERLMMSENTNDPVVLGIPRGGVPVAFEISRAFRAPLDILVICKVGLPDDRDFGVGAVAEDASYWVNWQLAADLGVRSNDLISEILGRSNEVRKRIKKYRRGKPPLDLTGKSVILVDEALATGFSASVAVRYLRGQGVSRITLAVPISSHEGAEFIAPQVDEFVYLDRQHEYTSVGDWYRDYHEIPEQDVLSILFPHSANEDFDQTVEIDAGEAKLPGRLTIPAHAKGIVIFAHGSGSGMASPRNNKVARDLQKEGLGTLLLDLLTPTEGLDREKVFDIELLASRLSHTTRWLKSHPFARDYEIGYFGASTGAGAALVAAAKQDNEIAAIVSRGGRPDLAGPRLVQVDTPTLLIVGGDDLPTLRLNEEALPLIAHAELIIVPGATHLFEEPGTLEQVSEHAIHWFKKFFQVARKKAA